MLTSRPVVAVSSCHKAVMLICILLLILETLTLLTFLFPLPYLKIVLSEKPISTSFFILTCIVLLILQKEKKTNPSVRKTIVYAIITLLFLGSLAVISLHIFEIHGPIDHYMHFFTGCNFTIMAIALLLMQKSEGRANWSFQIFTVIIALNALFSLMGYIFQVSLAFPITHYTRMDIQTSINFLLLCIAMLLARPQLGLTKTFFANSLAGALLRKVPIIVFVATIIISLISNFGEKHGLYDDSFGDVFTLINNIGILILVLWFNADLLSKEESKFHQIAYSLDESKALTKQRLAISHDIAKIIEASPSIPELVSQLLPLLTQAFAWDYAEFNLVDNGEVLLKEKSSYSTPSLQNSNLQLDTSPSLLEDFTKQILRHHRARWEINNLALPSKDGLEHAFHTGTGLPIAYKGEVLAVLTLYSLIEKKYDRDMLALLELIGFQLGEYLAHLHTVRQIKESVNIDHVTGLLNKAGLIEEFNKKIRDKPDAFYAIIVFDIDQFKLITDALGDEASDILKKDVVQRLLQLTNNEDLLAHVSGDKFFYIPHQVNNTNQAIEYVYRIFAVCRDMFLIKSKELFISPSIGISFYPKDGHTIDKLMNCANTALNAAHKEGGKNFQIFSTESMQESVSNLTLENEMHRALQNNQFVLFYQPKISLTSGKIVGVEALIRWQHPERGLIPPGVFMPIAEESGLIIPITEWIVREIFSLIANKDLSVSIAINLSPRHIRAEYNLVAYLGQMLKGFHIDPKQIELEITEIILLEETERVLNTLANLRSMGFGLVLDDFGTKFSSLNYLKNIAVDKVKLDKSFIDNIPSNLESITIVKAIIALFHALDKRIVAEGVENIEQIIFLYNEHCDEIQGNYFAPALPLHEVQALIAEKNWHNLLKNLKSQ